jgi:hypothetical protein
VNHCRSGKVKERVDWIGSSKGIVKVVEYNKSLSEELALSKSLGVFTKHGSINDDNGD